MAGAFVNLLGLGDAEAILRVAPGRLVKHLFPVGRFRPARQRVQQPGAQFRIRPHGGARGGGQQSGFTIQGFQKGFGGFHLHDDLVWFW